MDSLEQQQLSSLRLADDDDEQRPDWASLPLDILKICLLQLKGDHASKRAALASCKAFARAVLRSSANWVSFTPERSQFQPAVHVWRELWGQEQPQQGQRVALVLLSYSHDSPGRCLDQLLSAPRQLDFVTELRLQVRAAWYQERALYSSSASCCVDTVARALVAVPCAMVRDVPQCLALDVVLPPGISALLPNLQELHLWYCVLTPAARTTVLDTSCRRLRRVTVTILVTEAMQQAADAGAPEPWPNNGGPEHLATCTAQLRQLAKLPSLSSVELASGPCPTLFLVALSAQLTQLGLGSCF